VCFSKTVQRIQDSLKSEGYFTWSRPIQFLILSHSFLRIMRNVTYKTCRQNQNTFCVDYSFFENRAVYEIMWKNIVERGRVQMTIWRMQIACWITKPTHTHTHTHTHTTHTTHTPHTPHTTHTPCTHHTHTHHTHTHHKPHTHHAHNIWNTYCFAQHTVYKNAPHFYVYTYVTCLVTIFCYLLPYSVTFVIILHLEQL
jgi:hypothetical protein